MAIFLAIGIVLVALAAILFARAAVLPRRGAALTVDQITSYGYEAAVGVPEVEVPVVVREPGPIGQFFGRGAVALGKALANRIPGSDTEEVRKTLLSAGLYNLSPAKFLGYRIVGTVALPIFWLWIASGSGKSTVLIILGLILCVGVGWMLPLLLVKRKAQKRLDQIEYEMPDLIDTLVATVEAGIAFGGSLQIAARRFHGPLAEDLQLLLQEQNMGLGLNQALNHLLERADTPAMRSFVRSVVQGEMLGVSISQSLRALAVEMRARRRALAEEKAQRAPVKMLFPLVLLIFPSIFIILLGPLAFKIKLLFGGG